MMAELPVAGCGYRTEDGCMIPFHMGMDLAEQHAADLRRMVRTERPLRARTTRWCRRDNWRLRIDGWIRARSMRVRWAKRPPLRAAAPRSRPCPR